MNWKKLSSEYISQHPYFTARKDRCEMPDGKIVDAYYLVELPPSACALAITEEGKVLIAKQYRHPLEETGYEFSDIEYLGKVAGNPGLLTGYTYLYLARGGKKKAAQSLDANEEIEVLHIPLEEVRAMLMRNEFVQALHVSCMLYAFQKLDAENAK